MELRWSSYASPKTTPAWKISSRNNSLEHFETWRMIKKSWIIMANWGTSWNIWNNVFDDISNILEREHKHPSYKKNPYYFRSIESWLFHRDSYTWDIIINPITKGNCLPPNNKLNNHGCHPVTPPAISGTLPASQIIDRPLACPGASLPNLAVHWDFLDLAVQPPPPLENWRFEPQKFRMFGRWFSFTNRWFFCGSMLISQGVDCWLTGCKRLSQKSSK